MLDEATSRKVTIKEGCSYKLQIGFRVQNELVAGLKYKHAVQRMGITVLLGLGLGSGLELGLG